MESVDVEFEGEVEGRFRAKQWTDWENYISDPFYRGSGVQLLKAVGLARREQLDEEEAVEHAREPPDPQHPGSTARWYKGILPEDVRADTTGDNAADPHPKETESKTDNDAVKRNGVKSFLTEPRFSKQTQQSLPTHLLSDKGKTVWDNRRPTLPSISREQLPNHETETEKEGNQTLEAAGIHHGPLSHRRKSLIRRSSFAVLPGILKTQGPKTKKKDRSQGRKGSLFPSVEQFLGLSTVQAFHGRASRHSQEQADRVRFAEISDGGLSSIKEHRDRESEAHSRPNTPSSSDSLPDPADSSSTPPNSDASEGFHLPALTNGLVTRATLKRTSLLNTSIGRKGSMPGTSETSLDDHPGAKSVYLTPLRTRLARERFRHAVRMVVVLLKWVSSMLQKQKDQYEKRGGGGGGRSSTFTDLATAYVPSEEWKNSGLTFDLSQFKAKRELNISNEVKHILSLPPEMRSPEQLKTVLYGLQHLRSFAEYPLHMQEKLCKVAWYENVPPKRVIIRQGHYAENFYFILSGQAVVRITERNGKSGETSSRTATIMRKGMSFGELALLHHSRRTATVVSQDQVQLLTIGREDFFDIFMSGQRPGEIPEHIKFISNLDFMKDWPMDVLLQHPEYCLFHFFKRGVVIVKDSQNSDWLYIIKSGSCQVMKQLKGVTAKLGIRTSQDVNESDTKLPKVVFDHQVSPKVNNGRRKRRLITVPSAVGRAIQNFEKENVYIDRHGNHELDEDDSGHRTKNKSNLARKIEATRASHDKQNSKMPGYSKSRLYKMSVSTKAPHFASSSPPLTVIRRSTGPNSSQQSEESDESKSERKGPVFVQVELLKPRDVFGLTTVNFSEDGEQDISAATSVSLVSRGAECIMLSKRFFIQHANEKVKKMIRYQIRPYPTESTLQDNLQTKVDWDLYRQKLIKGLLNKPKTKAFRQY